MSTVLGRLGRTLPAAVAAVVLGACSNAASPTATTPATVATANAEQQPTASIIVQGTVVDSSNRPLAGAEVECMGSVQCVAFGAQVIQEDGPDDGVKTNAAGGYVMVVRRTGASDRFLMNATAKGYELMIREVAFADPTCSSDRAGCSVTMNFTLAPQAD
jgi:hypothetical protein